MMTAFAALLLLAGPFEDAARNGKQFDRSLAAMQRCMNAWLAHADAKTDLIPERIPGLRGLKPGDPARRYTSHNTGADLYPYLIVTAEVTDPELYRGRLLAMLRKEIQFATVDGVLPCDLELHTARCGPVNLFGASEYAKDGLLAVTELLGRTPWFYRMADVTAGVMQAAPLKTKWGVLAGKDAEINGDVLQVLARLIPMTGDPRYLRWARGIADTYVHEVLPGCGGLPCKNWDFEKHQGDNLCQLRDHGNETIVGLTLLYALDPRPELKQALEKMFDRILASANADGMLYDVIDATTLKPTRERLADNWGYVYGAMYAFDQATGGTRYREAVRHALRNLPKYIGHDWENGSFDGVADAVESAIYLYNREPVPEAARFIEAGAEDLLKRQLADGHFENWYGEGNFNRTIYLYALWKSQGVRPAHWKPGLEVGAVREGERLLVSVNRDAVLRFDFERHRRVLNLERNYVRLNEFPEWYTVDENRVYRLTSGVTTMERLGSELIAGVALAAGQWTVAPLSPAGK